MEPGSARGGWVERVAFAVGAIALAAVIAARAYPIGLIQGRYDVGAPGWVEGSFGWLYLVIGGIVDVEVTWTCERGST